MRHLPLGSPADASAGLDNAPPKPNSLWHRYCDDCRIPRGSWCCVSVCVWGWDFKQTLLEVRLNNAGHGPIVLPAQVTRRKLGNSGGFGVTG